MLRGVGLRVTRSRTAVLAALREHPHADTATIDRRRPPPQRRHVPPGGLRRPRALVAAGLVRCIEPQGSVPRYELRVGDNHHHVVCRSCGVVADVDCAVGYTPCLTAADDHGFIIDEAEVVYWGTCPAVLGPAERLIDHHQPGGPTMPEHHDAVVGDMQSEESEGGCPVVHGRTLQPPDRGRRQP